MARRAEIQQHRGAVTADENIGGLDIPVDEPLIVEAREGPRQGQEYLEHVGFRQAASFADDGLQRLAALVLHHHVAGVVQLEEIQHRYDVGIAEAGQDLAFFEKSLAAPDKGFGFCLRSGVDAAVVIPASQLLREVLLYGNRAIQIRIGREIGNSESASAENAFYSVRK